MACIIPVKDLLNGQGWYAKVLGLFLSFYENLEWWEIKKKDVQQARASWQ